MKVLGDHEISSYQNITSQNTQVYGHFQKYAFVEKTLPQIKKLLKSMNVQVEAEMRKIKYGECISLHVRRGDYVKMSHVHNVLSIHYYSDALTHFDEQLPLVVFSNDITWCRQNFEMFNRKIHYVPDDIPDYVQLGMMSKIKYNIIANSTFSWWAAVLNENVDKKVVSPKEWLCNSNIIYHDRNGIEISDKGVYFKRPLLFINFFKYLKIFSSPLLVLFHNFLLFYLPFHLFLFHITAPFSTKYLTILKRSFKIALNKSELPSSSS